MPQDWCPTLRPSTASLVTRARGQVGVIDSSFDSIVSFDSIDSFDSIESFDSIDSFVSLDLLACYSYNFQKLYYSINVLKPVSPGRWGVDPEPNPRSLCATVPPPPAAPGRHVPAP